LSASSASPTFARTLSYLSPASHNSPQPRLFSTESKPEEPAAEKTEEEAATAAAAAAEEEIAAAAAAAAKPEPAVAAKADPNDPAVLKKHIEEWRHKYLSALAEQQNTITRLQGVNEATKTFAIQNFAKAMIETVDVLTLAMKSVPEEQLASNEQLRNLYEGFGLVEKNILQNFKQFGVVRFDSLGEKFDPNLHDGLFQIDDPSRPVGSVGIVTNEGYKLGERVIRAAKVGTVKPREE
jgi:molecular chaperone GrpE (heat shock protein)